MDRQPDTRDYERMTSDLRTMIARAAARAHSQITQLHRGEYRPTSQVVTQEEGIPPGLKACAVGTADEMAG